MNWIDSIRRRLGVRPNRKSSLTQHSAQRTRRFRLEELEQRQVPSSVTEFNLAPASGPYGITTGPDGALWFTETVTNKIGRITTGGTITEYSIPTPNSNPESITTGSDGALWFTENSSSKIGRITTDGSFTEYNLAAGSHPLEITAGPNGNLWFTENGTNKIGEIVPSGDDAGTITEFSLAASSSPWGITTGPDGNIWFTENGTDKVANIVPSGGDVGTISEFSLSNGAGPRDIITGPDNNLWFIEEAGTNIGRVTTGGSVTEFATPDGDHPNSIVSGPNNSLYYTPFYTDDIGAVSTTGVFTSYAIPTSVSRTIGITLGPDNHIWFAEANTSKIGRLNLNAVATDDVFTAVEGTSLTEDAAHGVLANDTDPEGDPLSVAVEWTGGRETAHGFVNVASDGSFTYTPQDGYHGPDSFDYQTTDGTDESAEVTVTINVDAPPVAVADTYTAIQGTTLTKNAATGVLANDTDADGNPLSVADFWTGGRETAHGFVNLSADGSFTYTPEDGYHGPDSFDYQATDGTAMSAEVTVTINVDAPPVAVNDSYTAVQGTPLTVNAANGVLANDSGTGTLSVAEEWTGSRETAHGFVNLSADGSFVYTPEDGYHGPDSFDYQATDGTAMSAEVTVTINVDAPPVAVNDSYTTDYNTSLTKDAVSGVLSNDTDVDGDSLTAVLVDGPAHGTVTLNSDGSFTYTPNSGYSGNDSFTYKANDGNADGNTVTVSIAIKAQPVAVTDVNGDGRPDIIVGTATANSHIKVFDGTTGELLRSFYAFDGFDGGVATAGGDINGDGHTDIIVGTATANSHIKVFDGATGELLRSFYAFDGYEGGVVVASGDVNGDGFADIIVGTRTGSSHVKVFSGRDGSEISSFYAFDGYDGGVSLASGDVNGDGFDDIIVGAATGSSHVKVFSGSDGSLLRSYMAFTDYLGGVVVAAGDLNGDGLADIVVGAATGSSHVKAFSGSDGSLLRSFLALPGFTGDLSVAVADTNGDGVPDIIAGSKVGTARVTSVNGVSLSPTDSFLAFDDFLGGVAVS